MLEIYLSSANLSRFREFRAFTIAISFVPLLRAMVVKGVFQRWIENTVSLNFFADRTNV